MLRQILLILYIVLCARTAYRTAESISNFFQCEEEEVWTLQSFFIWMGVVDEPTPLCPSSSEVSREVTWHAVWLVMLVVFAEVVVMATGRLVRFRRDQMKKVAREETEALYFMENAMKYNGQIMILRLTKTKRQTFRFERSTRKFQLILTFPRQEEVEAGGGK